MELEHLWILVSEWVLEPIIHGNGGNDYKYREIEIEKKILKKLKDTRVLIMVVLVI